ncbi:hypothetical protein NON00_05515 [Roseomonas sp. GC11]|uniref:hypothetical protein n=1 Tax=Roseomonas sp. GC11 TaxID=2950546 RepID=UPI00210B72C7|nr:hypothetical protein [Roseomonas sp. GC11]MCQ4159380.1 hypothetical protein [Roseomonas sp. GC11]
MASALLLVGGMALSSLTLRPWLIEPLTFQGAVFMANGVGLLLGAAVNFGLIRWLSRRPEGGGSHNFLGLSMILWSMLGLLAGVALIAFALVQS